MAFMSPNSERRADGPESTEKVVAHGMKCAEAIAAQAALK
jgi:hypothetical protein